MRRAEGWQIALVCGLMLAGQPWTESCKIAHIGHRRLRLSLPADWTSRKVVRNKWRGARLAALAADYRAHSLTLQQIMDRHSVTLPMLRKLVTTHGWPRRPNNQQAIIATWCPERRKLYFKFRIHLGIVEARKAAWDAIIPSAGPSERPIPALAADVGSQGPAPFFPTESPALNSGGAE